MRDRKWDAALSRLRCARIRLYTILLFRHLLDLKAVFATFPLFVIFLSWHGDDPYRISAPAAAVRDAWIRLESEKPNESHTLQIFNAIDGAGNLCLDGLLFHAVSGGL
jgi:hypothetical protein